MSLQRNTSGRIHILPDVIAHKIAAGEVIERPASIVRELLDNSIDAGSSSIDLFIREGGSKEVRVLDDGSGMSEEDLKLCFLPHATSKIEHAEDLYRLQTLGFRGEALSSIAASSRLEIISNPGTESGGAHRIVIDKGRLKQFDPWKGRKGTTVSAADLFYALPARKQFLKNKSAEQNMCRQMLIEKALPFPEIQFRFTVDGETDLLLPAADRKDRIAAVFSRFLPAQALFETGARFGEDINIDVIGSQPDQFRRDRRYIYIFVNNRRVSEYAFLQAVEYGYRDVLPGGRFPYAFVFITTNPEFVDFNIHPAKKEARFRNLPELHHRLTSLLRQTLTGGETAADTAKPPDSVHPERERPLFSTAVFPEIFGMQADTAGARKTEYRKQKSYSVGEMRSMFTRQNTSSPPPDRSGDPAITFYGQFFNLFLLASVNDTLYIIDQHAAHERILYNALLVRPPETQPLLVPVVFEVSSDEAVILRENSGPYRELGITIEHLGEDTWHITTMPGVGGAKPGDVVSLIKEHQGSGDELRKRLFARIACRTAVQDGDSLDEQTARELIEKTLQLEEPRCPHGRPVWYTLSREELFYLLGRK